MSTGTRSSRLFGLVAVLSLAAVGIALYTQYALDMQPCPWCVLQRLVFVVIAVVALAGWAASTLRSGRVASTLAAVVALLAAAGLSAALWQHFVAAASNSCKLTLADRIVAGLGVDALLPQVFAAYASCADAKTTLLGIPYEFHSAALFVVIGATAVAAMRPSRGDAAPPVSAATR